MCERDYGQNEMPACRVLLLWTAYRWAPAPLLIMPDGFVREAGEALPCPASSLWVMCYCASRADQKHGLWTEPGDPKGRPSRCICYQVSLQIRRRWHRIHICSAGRNFIASLPRWCTVRDATKRRMDVEISIPRRVTDRTERFYSAAPGMRHWRSMHPDGTFEQRIGGMHAATEAGALH